MCKAKDVIVYEKKDTLGKIILNRPEKRNAIDLNLLKKLIDAFKQSQKNKDLCVIFTAEGKDFSVGDDLNHAFGLLMARTDPKSFQEGLEMARSFQRLTIAMKNHPGVLIAGLKGWVIGGAFEATLSCDLRVAAKDTKIMTPELNLGMMFSNASTKLLPKLIGESKAKELFLLGNSISADEAYRLGLVNRVVETASLVTELDSLARTIVEKDPQALKLAKRLIDQNQDADISATLDRELMAIIDCIMSESLEERIRAFVEKRKTK